MDDVKRPMLKIQIKRLLMFKRRKPVFILYRSDFNSKMVFEDFIDLLECMKESCLFNSYAYSKGIEAGKLI